MAEEAVIIYRTPDGRLVPVTSDRQVAPGWTPVAGPMLTSEAKQQIAAMGGATQGSFQDSEIVQAQQPGGYDWAAQAAAQQRAQQKALQAKQAIQAPASRGGQGSDYTTPLSPERTAGLLDKYNPELTSQDSSRTGTRTDWQRRDDMNTRTEGLLKKYDPTSSSYGTGVAGLDGSTNESIPTVSNQGWMSGMPTMTSDQMRDAPFMVDSYLDQTGAANHANRGFMENAYGAYESLWGIQNPTSALEPNDLAMQGGDFIGGLSNATGGQYVDTRALWDQQFGDNYVGGTNRITENTSEMGKSQYEMVMGNIGAMEEWMGPRGSAIAQSLVTDAWYNYQQGGMNQGQSFLEYLRSIGADTWF